MAKSKNNRRKRKIQSLSAEEIALKNQKYADFISSIYEGNYGDYVNLNMEQFFRMLFERKGELRLQEKGKQHYRDGHYNAIIKKISRGGKESHLWWIVTDTLEGIHQYEKVKFAIVAPLTYIGKTRTLFGRKENDEGKETVDKTGLGNARYLFAIAIDLDSVTMKNMKILHKEIESDMYPDPSFIVTSGSGLHLYYCFENPIQITRKNMDLLNRLKHTMTRMLWRYNATSQQRKVEVHDINQGYRFPGTQTKTGRIVLGFTRHFDQPLYHTPSSLNRYVKTWLKYRPELFQEDRPISDAAAKYLEGNKILSAAESKELDKDLRLPAHWSLKTAREMFGEEWYQQVKEKGSVDWQKYPLTLYQNWLNRLMYGSDVHIGHRYWCIWILAAWAWNCRVSYRQLKRDADELMERFNEILDDDNKIVPFTTHDCSGALSIYREHAQMKEWKPIRLSRRKTVRITGLPIEPAKRNYRSLNDHLRMMRENYKSLHDKKRGGDGEETRGRKSLEHMVRQWREEHPGNENKSECARDLGISRPTVVRWWDADQQFVQQAESKVYEIAEEAQNDFQLSMASDPKFREWQEAMQHMSEEQLEGLARLAELMKLKK